MSYENDITITVCVALKYVFRKVNACIEIEWKDEIFYMQTRIGSLEKKKKL